MPPKRTRGGDAAQLDKYEVGKVLGQGSFAVVKSVVRKSDKERFAMKLIDMELSDANEVEHERKILTHLTCFLVRLVGRVGHTASVPKGMKEVRASSWK